MAIQLLYQIPDDPLAPSEHIFKPNQIIFPITYLNASPQETLKNFISEYYIANYLGLKIPTKSRYANIHEGIIIKQMSDEVMGIEGKIDDLKNNKWFERAKHPLFTEKELHYVGEQLKEEIDFQLRLNKVNLSEEDIQNYLFVFQNLHYKISAKDIHKIIDKRDKIEKDWRERMKKQEEAERIAFAKAYKKHSWDIPLGSFR